MEINYTPEERAALDSILKNISDIVNDVGGQEENITNRAPAELLRDPTSPEAVELEKIDAAGRDRLHPYVKQYQDLKAAAEARSFAEIAGDPEKIIADVRRSIPAFIEKQYAAHVPTARGALVDYMLDNELLAKDANGKLCLHFNFARALCASEYRQHLDALQETEKKQDKLQSVIDNFLKSSRFVSSPNPKGPAVYRTKRRAGDITKTPEKLAVPTLQGYEYSTSLYHKGDSMAHLNIRPQSDVEMEFTDGKMSIINGGNKLNEFSRVELEDLKTKAAIDSIDLQNLRVFYNIILDDYQKTGILKDVYTIFIPDLLIYMGSDKRTNKAAEKRAREIVESYHNIIGVCVTGKDGQGNPRKKRLPVLLFEGDDEGKNTISFSSPYLKEVIQSTISAANPAPNPPKKGSRKKIYPRHYPSHSYMIKPEISKERNRVAIENVVILVQGVAQAGVAQAGGDKLGSYHISGATLLSRNVQLSNRFEASKNKGQLLNRVFSKTWRLLKEATTLSENYKNICVSVNGSAPVLLSELNPKDSAIIPTPATISTMVIEITHQGKRAKNEM